jgi:rubrerythrin
MSGSGDYISREAAVLSLLDKGQHSRRYKIGEIWKLDFEEIREAIKSIPAAGVRPVRRGKWKRVVDFTGVEAFGFKETTVVGWGCNVCGYEVDASEESFNYCPNCGADMREES